jgi:AbrB family looped-hinge helix DNA binding protein
MELTYVGTVNGCKRVIKVRYKYLGLHNIIVRVMETVTLSSKGQIVIPAGLRKRMKLKTKDRLIIAEGRGGILLKPIVQLSTMLGKYKITEGTPALRHMRVEDEKTWVARIVAMEKKVKN